MFFEDVLLESSAASAADFLPIFALLTVVCADFFFIEAPLGAPLLKFFAVCGLFADFLVRGFAVSDFFRSALSICLLFF